MAQGVLRVAAKYAAASRSGARAASAAGGDIRVVELGAAVNYWHTKRFKLSARATLMF